ncbi:MAG: hypothetical protein VX246_06925 [Myxococcota bacterium]|nr:hypothetical protein [Myxococcota bacterium]
MPAFFFRPLELLAARFGAAFRGDAFAAADFFRVGLDAFLREVRLAVVLTAFVRVVFRLAVKASPG